MKIMKFDLVSVENCIFINKCFSCKSYYVFGHLYILATGRYNHQTRFTMNDLLIRTSCHTSKFGTKAFLYSTITSWNSFQALFAEKNFRIISPINLKKAIKILFVFIICLRNTISIIDFNMCYNMILYSLICVCSYLFALFTFCKESEIFY